MAPAATVRRQVSIGLGKCISDNRRNSHGGSYGRHYKAVQEKSP